jgi:excisionase family DNA binding protein
MPDRLWRLREVGSILSLAPRTLRGYIAQGTLEAVKLPGGQWRVSDAALEAFIAGKKTGVDGGAAADAAGVRPADPPGSSASSTPPHRRGSSWA